MKGESFGEKGAGLRRGPLGTEAMSPAGRGLVFGSFVKGKVTVSLQEINVSLCNDLSV